MPTRPPARTRPALSDWRVIAVGRMASGPEAALFDRYNARLRPRLAVSELPDGRGSPVEIKRQEATRLLAAIPAAARVVALDQDGETPDSARFASQLTAWIEAARPICFVIGGAEGLDASVLARADHRLSFGRLTWPHLLVRAMLAEQVFRARAIATGHPYHRDGRP